MDKHSISSLYVASSPLVYREIAIETISDTHACVTVLGSDIWRAIPRKFRRYSLSLSTPCGSWWECTRPRFNSTRDCCWTFTTMRCRVSLAPLSEIANGSDCRTSKLAQSWPVTEHFFYGVVSSVFVAFCIGPDFLVFMSRNCQNQVLGVESSRIFELRLLWRYNSMEDV